MTHSRVRNGIFWQASSNCSIFHLRVTGMMASRTSLFEAFSESASFGRTVSVANRSIPGSMPLVDTVIRDSGMPIPSTSSRTAFMNSS